MHLQRTQKRVVNLTKPGQNPFYNTSVLHNVRHEKKKNNLTNKR